VSYAERRPAVSYAERRRRNVRHYSCGEPVEPRPAADVSNLELDARLFSCPNAKVGPTRAGIGAWAIFADRARVSLSNP
jgi:hypothetical protein